MRLWHEELISYLPRKQLLGQHRECCALRGNGWGKKHSTVDYIFKYTFENLFFYHMIVINEMKNRGYNIETRWIDCLYRGKNCEPYKEFKQRKYIKYIEHDNNYLKECINNLKNKKTNPFNLKSWDDLIKNIK